MSSKARLTLAQRQATFALVVAVSSLWWVPCKSTVREGTKSTRGQARPAVAARAGEETAVVRADNQLQLPDSDDGLPGTGSIRRYPWFRELWQKRREQWAQQVAANQGAVVFLGDSITQGWGDDFGHSFGTLKVANRGISGDTTRGLLLRISDVVAVHPRAVVILIGTNDIEEGDNPNSTTHNLELLINALEVQLPSTPLLLSEIFPSSPSKQRPKEKIVYLNRAYAKLVVSHPSVHLVRIWATYANSAGNAKVSEFPDLLHPNAIGYAKWADALRAKFLQLRLLAQAETQSHARAQTVREHSVAKHE